MNIHWSPLFATLPRTKARLGKSNGKAPPLPCAQICPLEPNFLAGAQRRHRNALLGERGGLGLDQLDNAGHDLVELEILGRIDGRSAALFEDIDVIGGDDAADDDRHVAKPGLAQALRYLAHER